ncbi:helix-turn-helix domain-containing protein [Flectobacillus roseus]|jgi:transcriptional regulator with XRE-family HTH domain
MNSQNQILSNQKLERILFEQIGTRIKHFRKQKGFSQEELASLVNISRSSVVNIENFKQNPSLFLIYQIAQALEIPSYRLLPEKIGDLSIGDVSVGTEIEPESEKLLKDFLNSGF